MDFSADGSTGSVATGIHAVYVKFDGGSLANIFARDIHASTSCRYIGSPCESGLVEFDNKVQMPTKVTISGVAKSGSWDCLETAKEAIESDEVVRCKVYGKNCYYDDMLVESIEEIGTSEMFDAIEVRITLVEYMESE